MDRTRGRKWMATIALVRSTNPYCVDCKAKGIIKLFDEVDHIVPLHKGGTDDIANLRGLCFEHHKKKSCKDLGKRYRGKVGLDGIPIDPDHPWNR